MLVVTHKKYSIIRKIPYKTIVVGNESLELDGAWRDNSNDNISNKNTTYCELTALYWLWKNKLQEYDCIGLCHYRRMFTKNRFSTKEKFFLTDKDINIEMMMNDIILPEKFYWKLNVAQQYYEIGQGHKKDLELTENAIKSLYPEYLSAYYSITTAKSASYCNMFIMSANNLNMYCKWLFDILDYVEERIDMTGYSKQEKRVFGYLAEILLNVWVKKHQLKIKYYPIAYLDMSSIMQCKMAIRNLGRQIKFYLIY